jgi:hypothetical protein
MSLVILHHLLNVSVQLANKWGFKQKKFSNFHQKYLFLCCNFLSAVDI